MSATSTEPRAKRGGRSKAAPKPKDGGEAFSEVGDEVGRKRAQAAEKDELADELLEAGDSEGAHIARVESDALRSEASELENAAISKRINGDEAEPIPGQTTVGDAIADVETESASKSVEMRNEAGEPVDKMPEMPLPDAADPPAETIMIAGVEMEYPSLGGKAPTSASLKFIGGKVELVEGTGFRKNQRIKFSGEAVVVFVGQQDTTDSQTGIVTSAEQVHRAQIDSLKVELIESE